MYSASSPHSPVPCLLRDQNFAYTFWNYFKIWPVISERRIFLRISSCLFCASSPHSPEPRFLMDQTFAISFLKRVTIGTFQWNNFKWVPEKIFKELLRKFCLLAMATRVFDRIKFFGHFLKRTSKGTFLSSLPWSLSQTSLWFCSQVLKTMWEQEQEGHDGIVWLHWLICKIPSYQPLQYLGIGLKHTTPKKDYNC